MPASPPLPPSHAATPDAINKTSPVPKVRAMVESMAQRTAAGQGAAHDARIAAMRRSARFCCVFLFAITIATRAYAHDELERGVAAYYSADFERALEAFAL